MSKLGIICLILVCVVLFSVIMFFTVTKSGRAIINNWTRGLKQVDDDTEYDRLKVVEDTCRTMIAQYTKDKLTYEQYKDSEIESMKMVAEQAKMRANSTAANYNNYVLKNSYRWKNNVPADIYMNLAYID